MYLSRLSPALGGQNIEYFFLTFNEKKILEEKIKAFSFCSTTLRLWSLKRWSLFLEVPHDEQVSVKMSNSVDMPSNIFHTRKDIS